MSNIRRKSARLSRARANWSNVNLTNELFKNGPSTSGLPNKLERMHVELDPVFEKWWKSQGVINDRDKSKARVAFVAAYKLALKQKAKTYNFQAGRWTVTVLATSMKDAKILATAKLNERAEKLLAKPPAGGWGLRLVAEKAEENLR